MTKKISEVLKEAKQLISKPENWTTGVYARDAEGIKVDTGNARATCFCSLGAVFFVAKQSKLSFPQRADIIQHIKEANGLTSPVHEYNDTHTHAEVMALWDKAIAAAEAQEAEENSSHE